MRRAATGFVLALLAGGALGAPPGVRLPRGVFVVVPISATAGHPTAQDLPIVRGRYFSYVLPANWRVAEDGQFALTLVAPDMQAFTLMTGNAGMFPNYPLDRYVREKMAAIRPQNLQVSAPLRVAPRTGFQAAYQFSVSYVSQRGRPSRGVVKCNVGSAYDTALVVMTGAFSIETQWANYASWLPLAAEQISAVDGAAFGRRGIMAQNLRLSKDYGEASRAYREWSQRNWQQVTDERATSTDRQNYYSRENLGSTKAYTNPYDTSAPVDLPQTYKYYWVNRQGTYVGTNDPSVDLNNGSTDEWKQMPRVRP